MLEEPHTLPQCSEVLQTTLPLQLSPVLGHTPSNLTGLSPEAQIEALKYENSKLKVALASR